ncbi:AlwI family type II restriction endonuclease [Helicobacter sp. MIT 11-5569]|uniref:AlwI family type II restriction endonuclease n=1 Tax=Helicobacter sp. MIT 11-5569 TaxID=1548151 RepID=UPI00068D6671|nr:AlwI family type II restriction endonuclease [Helicobacter sp. MIT 11-5569]
MDFNTFELPKIEYVIANYSRLQNFVSKEAYFSYMGEIDSNILEFRETINLANQNVLKIQTLEKFAKEYSREQIYRELTILSSKRLNSADEVFKFIPEPTRFEFLTAIALKQNFNTLEVLPNYSIDDEGLPKCHAGGNMPDILCKDSQSQSIIEVSLICGRGQVNNEILPIARHLENLIESNQNQSIACFAIFIAPKIFKDTQRYTKFLKYDENLDIRNFDIVEFIDKLQIAYKDILSINKALVSFD